MGKWSVLLRIHFIIELDFTGMQYSAESKLRLEMMFGAPTNPLPILLQLAYE